MQKKFLVISVLALCVFACGCDNTETVEPVVNPEPVADVQCTDDCIEETVDGLDSDVVEIAVAEKNEWEDMITISEWDWDSEHIAESQVFEAPIE